MQNHLVLVENIDLRLLLQSGSCIKSLLIVYINCIIRKFLISVCSVIDTFQQDMTPVFFFSLVYETDLPPYTPPTLYPWLGNVNFLHHHMHVIWCHPPQMVKMSISFMNSSPGCATRSQVFGHSSQEHEAFCMAGSPGLVC